MQLRLIKTGAVSKDQEAQLSQLSVWAEFIGYIGSLSLHFIKLQEIKSKEKACFVAFEKKRKVSI